MLLENPGLVHRSTFMELEGSYSQDMLKRDGLCFLLKEKHRINSLLLSASDTNQFSIQILLTMIVQFGISVDSMKSNKALFNIYKPPFCNFSSSCFWLKTIPQNIFHAFCRTKVAFIRGPGCHVTLSI